jgi:putative endonuclease
LGDFGGAQPNERIARSWRVWKRLRELFARGAPTPARRLGDRGERLARAYLRGCGYRIVATNVRVPVGVSPSGRAVVGEIDVVAYEGDTLTFVEVKTRRREGLYATERAVDVHKRALLVRAARRYRGLFGVSEEPYRFDVVAVTLPDDGRPSVRLTRGAFPGRAPRSREP